MADPDDRSARLLQAGMALASELSLPTLLQRIVELAADLTGARYGALGVIGAGGNRLVDFLTTGIGDGDRAAIGALPHGRGLLGALIHDARPLRVGEISRDSRSAGFPPHHPPMTSFLGAPVLARGQVFGNLYLTEKRGGSPFTTDDEEALVILASQAGIAIANARLYEEAQHRERWLQAAREVAGGILRGDEVDAVLRQVARWARELARADRAVIMAPAPDGELRITVAEGLDAAGLEGRPVPAHGSVSGEVIRSGRPMVIADASTDPRAFQAPGVAPVGASVAVPLTEGGTTVGSLAVANRAGGRGFDAEAVRLVESFAAQASLAMEYGRAQRELHRLSVAADRERIARELHDGVIQALFAVGLGLQGTAASVAEPRLTGRINDAVNDVDRVIGDLRSYISGLRPQAAGSGRELAETLSQIAHELEARSGIATAVEVDETLEIPLADRAVHIVQLTREALANVREHSGARSCRLTIRRRAGAAVLEIVDNGRGLDLDGSPPRSGSGFANLRNRSATIGGDLDITGAAGGGTRVRVTIPL